MTPINCVKLSDLNELIWFPTTVETVNLDAVTTILTFYRFGGHVLVGHR